MSDTTCMWCDEEIEDSDDVYTHIEGCKFVQTAHGGVKLENVTHGEACESCHDANTFYCNISDKIYSDNQFEIGEDQDSDNICIEAAKVAGYIQSSNGEWFLPAEPTKTQEGAVSASKYSDFYWYLKDGERRGMLQLDGGGEESMPKSLETKIHHRIQEAGGDGGDPHVVNVYTRLELIDQGILPKDYML